MHMDLPFQFRIEHGYRKWHFFVHRSKGEGHGGGLQTNHGSVEPWWVGRSKRRERAYAPASSFTSFSKGAGAASDGDDPG